MSTPTAKYARFGPLEFVVKVVAAFAALIPFLAAVESLRITLQNPKIKLLITDSRFFLITCFGISFAATGDVKATVVAIALATAIFQLGREEAMNGDFSFGYGTLVGMPAEEAAAKVRVISPSLHVEVRSSEDPGEHVPGRLQLVAENGVVVKYAFH